MKFAWHRRCVNQESEVLKRFNSGHVREKQAVKLSDNSRITQTINRYSNPSAYDTNPAYRQVLMLGPLILARVAVPIFFKTKLFNAA